MKKLLTALSLLLSANLANAAQISADITEQGNQYITIQGQILEGDSKTFQKILKENPRVKAVVLDSQGGLVYEGMVIAGIVNLERLDTFVLNNHVCFSICAAIFFSGNKKFIQKDATLGVHPAHDVKTMEKSAEVNAFIAWYFGRLGYDIGLVELWVSADPKSLNFITAEINQKFNLGIISID
jgi:hypothetical protein